MYSFRCQKKTINITTLKYFSNNTLVNIDFPLTYSSQLHGHIVSGHVNETGKIIGIKSFDNSTDIWIQVKKYENLKHKDSIAVDGISLTIAEIKDDMFRVAIIPHTLENTNIKAMKVNQFVNIEYNIESGDKKSQVFSDEFFMKKAIALGECGRNSAPPNPWVGCIIVKNNTILGEGFHIKAGDSHAEVNAFKNICQDDGGKNEDEENEAGEGADIYVTLEPCCHTGKTPPCVDLLIQKKVKRVIIGTVDPDSRVSGMGIKQLQEKGIEVITGVCEEEVKYSLRHYLFHKISNKPFVTLKIATSIDNAIQDYNGKSQWLTCETSRKHCHQLRMEHAAIMVGTNTVLHDNPSLTIRNPLNINIGLSQIHQPTRIVLDASGRIKYNDDINIFNSDAKTIIFTSLSEEVYRLKTGNKVIQIHSIENTGNALNIKHILAQMSKIGIISVLVEGGPTLHTSFIENGLANELYVYKSGHLLGEHSLKWLNNLSNRSIDELQLLSPLNVKIMENKDILEHYKITNYKTNDETNANKIEDERCSFEFSNITESLQRFKIGKMVIVVDDESRENEGDLIVAAEHITETQMTFIINNTTGIVCVPMTQEHADQLELPPMVINNTDVHQTAFTVSCDGINVTTGVSSKDRVATVKSLVSCDSSQLRRPGHIFPLVARKGLLKVRQGHTESALALCEICGLKQMAVISELKNDNGSMKNRQQCIEFAKQFEIPIISIAQIREHQNISSQTQSIWLSECSFTNNWGDWTLRCYQSSDPDRPHIVLIKGDVNIGSIPIRIHSECFTGDILGSYLCDCGSQLENAMKFIDIHGKGIIVYVNGHEGRGIGLTEKIKAYKLQQTKNITTYEANVELGHSEDLRNYDEIVNILQSFNIKKIHLLTNNPEKIISLNRNFEVTYEPIIGITTKENTKYLEDKVHYFESQSNKYEKKVLNSLKTYPNRNSIEKYKIAIVSTMWHQELIDVTKKETMKELNNLGN